MMSIVVAACFLATATALEVSPEFADSPAAQTAVGLTVVVTVLFGVFVVAYYKGYVKGKGKESSGLTSEYFITARGKSNRWRIAWSFYASAVGSWILTGPSELAFYSGFISVFMYGIAVGLPAIVIALFGERMRNLYPDILSLSDFVNWRFGKATQVMVVCITLLNMGVAATSEYTTIASFFSGYVGLGDFDIFIVILIALVTLSYTAYGGLEVSIITDQAQAYASIVLVFVLAIYILANLRQLPEASTLDAICITDENTSVVPCSSTYLDQMLGTTVGGYSTIFTLPLSLLCATVYSEAFWQRVWASESKEALRFGAFVAAFALFVVTSIFGLIGVYAGWTFLTGYASDPNLRVFEAMEGEIGQTIVSTGWGVLVILLGVIMSESALDSMQNGIGASVTGATSRFFDQRFGGDGESKMTLLVSRVIVIVLNVPLVIVGLQKYQIIRLFLITNMITSCATVPIVVGFVKSDFLLKYHNDLVPPISSILSLLTLTIFAMFKSEEGTFTAGIVLAFWDQLYEWDYFLVALLSSTGYTMLLIFANRLRAKAFGEVEVRQELQVAYNN